MATGHERFSKIISEKKWELITGVKDKLTHLLRLYYYVGGMPRAVSVYSSTKDLAAVRQIQLSLISSYDNDFSKHAPLSLVPRIRLVWNSVVSQLAKENKKFIYGLVREGAGHANMSWLWSGCPMPDCCIRSVAQRRASCL